MFYQIPQAKPNVLVSTKVSNWIHGHFQQFYKRRAYYRLSLNSELQEPNVLRAKKLQILLRIGLRTQVSAPNHTINSHTNKLIHLLTFYLYKNLSVFLTFLSFNFLTYINQIDSNLYISNKQALNFWAMETLRMWKLIQLATEEGLTWLIGDWGSGGRGNWRAEGSQIWKCRPPPSRNWSAAPKRRRLRSRSSFVASPSSLSSSFLALFENAARNSQCQEKQE